MHANEYILTLAHTCTQITGEGAKRRFELEKDVLMHLAVDCGKASLPTENTNTT